MKSNLTIKEYLASLPAFSKIGCVYPNNEESYYIHSNLGETEIIECSDGSLYREV